MTLPHALRLQQTVSEEARAVELLTADDVDEAGRQIVGHTLEVLVWLKRRARQRAADVKQVMLSLNGGGRDGPQANEPRGR